MSHSHQPGSCEHGPEKVDVQLESLLNSAPAEDSLPARILAKSREVAAQSGHKAVYTVGMDVGSTTVKAVVVDTETDQMIWQDYQRHETKQPEKLLEFLKRMQDEVGIAPHNCRIFITGSGGGALANLVGAKFVQEVTAVSLAVEKLHPEVNSVIELGGQDAKIIVFKEDENTGRKKKIPSMNDKCAGGTGAVIDKINAKLKIPAAELCDQGYTGIKLHPVAGKCGVFAETDINGLQKQGIPPDQLMASLFDAIVLQNLTVLTRGHTLRPHVLLLGGPNSFIRGMKEAWQQNIPRTWEERKVQLPEGAKPEELIKVPENAQYFAALGAVEFGKDEEPEVGIYMGTECLEDYITVGRQAEKAKSGAAGLSTSDAELAGVQGEVSRPEIHGREVHAGRNGSRLRRPRWRLDLDQGRAALRRRRRDVQGLPAFGRQSHPGHDRHVRRAARSRWSRRDATLEVLGVGTTGYAKDVLKDVLKADVALVETVAHTESAMKFYKEPHVIVDVGGQDIKLIILKDGRVKDFKLNTQCSAGNGYFLQGTAESLGYKVEDYADIAFSAEHHADLRLRLRGVHAVRHRELPAPGMARRRDSCRTGERSAEEHLPVRRGNSEPRQAGIALHPAGRDAEEPGGGEVRSRLHSLALPRRRAGAGGHRSRALRRVGSNRRGRRSDPPLQERPSHDVHRHRSGAEDRLQAPRATKTRAATSARTIACARSSTSMSATA